jgi:uncharacterized membrane protein YdjX (TVP38/TMEM64 family)
MKHDVLAMTDNPSQLKRWGPLVVLVGLIGLAYALGLQKYLTLGAIVEHRAALQEFVNAHLAAALLIYALIYISVVALSLPAAALLSIFGGFIFGWLISAPVTVVAATIGAVIVFQIVKTSIGSAIAQRAGPFVKKLSDGFAKDAFNYLLFLRLVPAFPFFAVNAVAGICRVDLKTFAVATLIGIIPGSFAFAWLGRGLDSLIQSQNAAHDVCVAAKSVAECPFELSPSALITPQLLIAFAVLGVVSLIPVALKKWKSTP